MLKNTDPDVKSYRFSIPSALLFHVLSAAMVSLDTLSSAGEGVGGSGKRE
jgi:hypothetical protein